MRTTLLATLALALPAAATATAQNDQWLTDFDAAKAAAKKQDKLILANFTGSDWCHWCIKLKKEVFSKPEFEAWAEKNVIRLELDFPRRGKQSAALEKQNRDLASRFDVRGYPTVLFLDASGDKVGQMGYAKGGAKNWIKLAEEQMRSATADAEKSVWLTDYKAALQQAKKANKLVLADFTGSDWCGWCIKLKKEVFDTPEFKAWADKNVVLLELDFPRKSKQSAELKKQNRALAEKFSVRGYPTILFVNSSGEQVGKMGYERGGPKAWLRSADRVLAKARDDG